MTKYLKAKNESDMLSHTDSQHTGYQKHSSLECRGDL